MCPRQMFRTCPKLISFGTSDAALQFGFALCLGALWSLTCNSYVTSMQCTGTLFIFISNVDFRPWSIFRDDVMTWKRFLHLPTVLALCEGKGPVLWDFNTFSPFIPTRLEQAVEFPAIRNDMVSMWRHCNVVRYGYWKRQGLVRTWSKLWITVSWLGPDWYLQYI